MSANPPLSFERLKYILFGAGLFCFGLAGVLSAVLPVSHLSKIQYRSLEEVVREPPRSGWTWSAATRRR